MSIFSHGWMDEMVFDPREQDQFNGRDDVNYAWLGP